MSRNHSTWNDEGARPVFVLTVRGTTRPLAFTATAPGATADGVTLTAELSVAPADFGLTWNKLGMMKGQTAITVEAHFIRGRA
ncbi:YceI family protein [Streptomyces sp. FXJ1.4098]|nr:YceI family protein [Streptomyces sp. FXJ1.4098]